MELQQAIPGFVGLAFGADGAVQVRLADFRQSDRARAVLTEVLRADPPPSEGRTWSVVFLPALVQLPDLNGYKARMRDVLNVPGVVYLDLDEACACITVGIRSASVEPQVQAFAGNNAVPPGIVRTRITSPILRLAKLTDSMRPVKGGLHVESANGPCTLGLAVYHYLLTRKGLLTASHCTEGSQGGSLGTWFAQPGGAWFWGDKIGEERIDPFMFTNSEDTECPVGRRCRRTDVAFAQFDQSMLGIVGRIARPAQKCTTFGMSCSVDLANPSDQIMVNGLAPAPSMGELRGKIGTFSGWSEGRVSSTCVDGNVTNRDGSDTGMTILCQHSVAATSEAGDSGSPVFVFRGADNTALFAGILWGSNDSEFVYSPVASILAELGSMAFFE